MTGTNPGLAGSEFGERPEPNFGSAVSEKGPGRTLVWQVRSSVKGPFLSLNSELLQVRSSDRAES